MSFPEVETAFLLAGPAGDLEVLATPAAEKKEPPVIAVICHPHPLFGGTMTNKVGSTIARTLLEMHISVVRFNFRGVGKSQGSFAEGIGELEDLRAVIKWVKEQEPNCILWLAGFSFGGYIAARMATQIPVAQLITVAPQASRFTAEPFPEITAPWILVQGEADEVVPPQEVFDWVNSLEKKPVVIRMPEASHFFHGQLMELRRQLTLALQKSD